MTKAALATATDNNVDTWTNNGEDDRMFARHLPLWRTMIDNIQERNLINRNVLDYGCSQGGLLRTLYHNNPFAKGVGTDIAREAVDKANKLNPGLPIEYGTPEILDRYQGFFDIAMSHEVIYLFQDLEEHARTIHNALRPGGVYYAATGCHKENPLWPAWYKIVTDYSNVPVPNYSLDDYVNAFEKCGFTVELKPFQPDRFVWLNPMDKPIYDSVFDAMVYQFQHKILFRFARKN